MIDAGTYTQHVTIVTILSASQQKVYGRNLRNERTGLDKLRA